MKTSWNLKECKMLIEENLGKRIGSKTDTYLQSIALKVKRIDYHAGKAKNEWNALLIRSVISLRSKYFKEAIENSTAEIEALIQNLNSLGDILAKIVYLVVLRQQHVSGRVYLYKVIKALNDTSIAPRIQKGLENFSNHHKYQYIRAFCNTMKHENMIDIDYIEKMVFINKHKSQKNKIGLRFRRFKNSDKIYSTRFAFDLIDKYQPSILDLLYKAGNEINNHFR